MFWLRRSDSQRGPILQDMWLELEMTTMPNQIAARNSRERLSFVASGCSLAPFTFATGAHPAVRELFR